MIIIKYAADDSNLPNNCVNEESKIKIDDDASLATVFYSFIRICEFAGYSIVTFDQYVKEASEDIEDGYTLKDYFVDKIWG